MKRPASRCPTCGRAAMRRVIRDVTTRRAARSIVVNAVEIEECAHCGERLYDLAALRRLQDARRRRPRRRSAA